MPFFIIFKKISVSVPKLGTLICASFGSESSHISFLTIKIKNSYLFYALCGETTISARAPFFVVNNQLKFRGSCDF